ncbi:thioredoxin family protein [Roseovarius indicus]|uniref:thioredoxin family protein n=1 Tax=Roseovarius indicus TaxID=540747 RepID=UPI0032EFCFB1
MTRLMSLVAALMLALPVYAAEMGDDGLHKADWMRETFKDLNEDLAEANAEGKRLMLLFEQRGCVYCRKMHEEVFSDAEVADYIRDNYFVVQMNLHGDTEIVDFDGEALTEKAAARKWGLLFTPTILYLPEEVEEGKNAAQAAVASQPGAFSKGTTLDLMTWVEEKRYELDNGEDFQRYHARRIKERDDGKTD